MAPSKTAPADFTAFTKMMSKALKLGQEHKQAKRDPATPLELAIELKSEARGVSMMYLRESYMAGFNW
jgi:hypothetical protein